VAIALREAAPADAEAITGLVNELAAYRVGQRESVEEVRTWFGLPRFQAIVAHDGDRLVGYGDVVGDEPMQKFWIDLREQPDRSGAAAAMLPELQGRAAAAARGPAVARAVVLNGQEELARLLERAGYRAIRHSFTMEIALGAEPAPAAWPEGVTVRAPAPGETRVAYDAYVETFADHWDFEAESYEDWERWNVKQPHYDPTLWFLAEEDGQVAGYSLCRLRETGGWVSLLGVRRPWRRRGLGAALLRHSFHALYGRGMRTVGLGVDGENTTGAVRLYERAGMTAIRRNDTYERAL
jgi:mycothiol synthase